MKKLYAALIITIMAFNPVLAFATSNEDDNDIPAPVVEQAPTEEPPTNEPPIVDNNDVPNPDIADLNIPAELSQDTPSDEDASNENVPNATPSNEDTPDISSDNPPVEPLVPENLNDTLKNDSTLNSIDAELSSDDKTHLEVPNEDALSEENLHKEHEHVFTYEYNGDGTHTKRCTEPLEIENASDDETDVTEESTEEVTEAASPHCDYEAIEECTYDEEGFCLYCKAEKPHEKEEFAPSISFSISNQTFNTGDPNPVISVSISQEDYDIAYAQVCFANYGSNKYINVGLAQGKYFDFLSDEFVYTSNDCWCASCDITSDYASGTYSLRSIYVKSTTGESIHYSIESDSLPAEYQSIDISLNMDAVQSDVSSIMDKPLIDIPAFYDNSEDDEAMDIPESIPEVIPDISEDKPQNDIEDYPIPSEPSSSETHEETNAEPIQEENIEEESDKLIEEPLLEEPAITQANDNESNNNSQSIIKDTITETIVAEDEQTPISSDGTESPNVDNENTKEETAQAEETTPTANDEQQSLITQFFNSIFKFVKKLFKWW